jgi:hypothetical protein
LKRYCPWAFPPEIYLLKKIFKTKVLEAYTHDAVDSSPSCKIEDKVHLISEEHSSSVHLGCVVTGTDLGNLKLR